MLTFFTLFLWAQPAFEQPIWAFSEKVWTDKTKVLLGNCSLESSYVEPILPKEEWVPGKSKLVDLLVVGAPSMRSFDPMKGYKTFRRIHQNRSQRLFALSNEGTSGVGVLYQLNSKHQRVERYFQLPFAVDEGYLVSEDVFYFNQWRTLLVVAVRGEVKSEVFIFDITDPNHALEPTLHYHKNEFLMTCARPLMLRLRSGQFGLLVAGEKQGGIIVFEKSSFPIIFPIEGGAFSHLKAVDLHSEGIVDRVYGVNAQGLWQLDLGHFDRIRPQKVVDQTIMGFPLVFSHPNRPGVRLYFLGKSAQGSGLFRFDDFSSHIKKEYCGSRAARRLVKGNYGQLIARFGKLLLIPLDEHEEVLVLDVFNEKITSVAWRREGARPYESEKILLSKILWDPRKKEEKLITLNASCQLSFFSMLLHKNQYGRTSYVSMD